ATLGNTRMRVILWEGGGSSSSTITPCGTYGYGETEDYLVNVFLPAPCSGTPVAGTATSNVTDVCPNAAFNLNLSGYTSTFANIAIQWEESPAGVGVWTPISGATNPSYTVTGGI